MRRCIIKSFKTTLIATPLTFQNKMKNKNIRKNQLKMAKIIHLISNPTYHLNNNAKTIHKTKTLKMLQCSTITMKILMTNLIQKIVRLDLMIEIEVSSGDFSGFLTNFVMRMYV